MQKTNTVSLPHLKPYQGITKSFVKTNNEKKNVLKASRGKTQIFHVLDSFNCQTDKPYTYPGRKLN